MSLRQTDTEAEQAGKSTKSLDSSLVKGIAWSGLSKWIVQLLTWVTTLLVARLLSPEDFGVVATATVYIGLIQLMSEFGIGSSIVMISGLTKHQISQVNTLSVLVGIVGFFVSYAVSGYLGIVFNTPALEDVVKVMGLGFIIESLQSVPAASLQREHRFKLISIIGTLRSLAQSVAVLAFAYAGFRYWSLVLSMLLGSVVGATLTLSFSRYPMAAIQMASISHILKFSWKVLVSRLSWYAYSNADFAIAGRVLGQTALGYYTVAWNIALSPLDKITTLVGKVTPSYYAAVKDDNNALRRYLLKPVEGIVLLLFPILIGVSMLSEEVVLVLLGQKWVGSVLVMRLLAIYACVRSFMPLFSQVLMAIGEAGFVMWNGIVSMFLIPLAFYVGSQWGIEGIAAAWVIAYPLNAMPVYLKVCRKIAMPHREFFRAIFPAVSACAVMVLVLLFTKMLFEGRIGAAIGYWASRQDAVLIMPYVDYIGALQWLLDGHFPPLVRLLAQTVCGACAYLLVLWVFHRDKLKGYYRGIALLRS